MRTKDNTSLLCCYCGEYISSEDKTLYENHLKMCLSKCLIPQKSLPSFYNELSFQEINNQSERFNLHLGKFEKKYKEGNVITVASISKQIEQSHSEQYKSKKNGDINNVNMMCIRCIQKIKVIDYPNHINNCVINELNDKDKILLTLINEMISYIVDQKDNDYLLFIVSQFENFLPLFSNKFLFCFVCGQSIQSTSFLLHYTQCKKTVVNSCKEDENEFTEPFNFDIVMNALSNGKEIPNEELKEYSIQARKIYNNSNRNKTKNGTITIRLNKNRKKSMQQLKKIANEEIKSFLSLPVKTIPLHKKSSKNFQHLGNPFDNSV